MHSQIGSITTHKVFISTGHVGNKDVQEVMPKLVDASKYLCQDMALPSAEIGNKFMYVPVGLAALRHYKDILHALDDYLDIDPCIITDRHVGEYEVSTGMVVEVNMLQFTYFDTVLHVYILGVG